MCDIYENRIQISNRIPIFHSGRGERSVTFYTYTSLAHCSSFAPAHAPSPSMSAVPGGIQPRCRILFWISTCSIRT